MSKERLAVIGGGIAGLGAAWLLRNRYDVTVFERERHIGGHSNTVEVDENGRRVPIDTGFMVFNKVTYPYLVRLFDELRVPIKPTEMSFSVRNDELDIEYNGMGLNRVFAQRANLVRPRFLRLLAQIMRFFRVANASLDDESLEKMSLDEFVRRHRLGDDFLRLYLVPMSASIWSITPGGALDFPAATLVRFFHNHGFLGVTTHHPWFTVDGGSREYVKRMLADLPRTHASSPVASVEAGADQATVRTKDGAAHTFDRAILALGTRALAALIGQQAARSILLSGEVVDSAQALAIGLLTGLVDSAEGFAAEVEATNGRFGRLDAASAALALRNTSGQAAQAADADLADLVRSVVRPGLKQRIAAYRGEA